MRAFVIGNAALDETLSITSFPEPGASIFGTLLSRDLGGKGVNQAVALARTGLDCVLAAGVGADGRGREIAARLASEPLAAHLIEIPGVDTDFSTILSTPGDNAIITTREAASALTSHHVDRAMAPARSGDLLVLQGNLSRDTTATALQSARALGLRIAMNPSPLQTGFATLLKMADMVFVNESEASALGGSQAILDAGAGQVVVTLGGAGATLLESSGQMDISAHPSEVVDTTGAGDCFMAVALASACLRGTALDARALNHGARAAACTVARPGTVAALPNRSEMATILAS